MSLARSRQCTVAILEPCELLRLVAREGLLTVRMDLMQFPQAVYYEPVLGGQQEFVMRNEAGLTRAG